MDNKALFDLTEEIMTLFRGLRMGTVNVNYDNLLCAMKPDLSEEFSNIAEEVVLAVEFGKEVTKEQLQTLYDNLCSFAKEYGIKDAKKIAAKIKPLLEANDYY